MEFVALALPLVLVAVGALAGLALALQRPVLFRMGLRNALRRRGQTAVVVAGLMVGTAIIAGSLATGDSLAYGIRKGAFDGLGPADEFVLIEGQLAFPRSVFDALAANRTVTSSVHAMSPILLEDAAVTNPREKQSEPAVSIIGFDPALDRPFESFHLPDGRSTDGSELGPNEVYVEEKLAQKLALVRGDTLTLHYAHAQAPIVPRVYQFNGTLAAGAGSCVPPSVPTPVPAPVPVPNPLPAPVDVPCVFTPGTPATPQSFRVPVLPGAVSASAILLWFGPGAGAADLDPTLVAPSGRAFTNGNGTALSPDLPAILNVTTPNGLETGNWTFRVDAKAAANQPFTATVLVFYEVYDLAELRKIGEELQKNGFDAKAFSDFARDGNSRPLTANFTVKSIIAREGKGDFLLGSNVFMRLDRAQRLYALDGKINLILVSNDGSVDAGVAATRSVNATLGQALAKIRADHPGEAATKQVGVRGVKESWLKSADQAGTLFKEFLTTIGSFTIVAGVMLIVNIFVMLAEERKSELGMARAVGLTRRQLVLLFGFEGSLYALAASLIGTVLGLALAWTLITGFNAIVSQNPETLVDFPFHPEASSLAWAFAVGFFLTMATVALAAHKVSKLNVVRAIRRIEEPPRRAGRAILLWGSLFLALGVAGTVWGSQTASLPFEVLSPCIGLIGLAMVLTRWFDHKLVYPLAGAATAAYATWTIFALPNPEGLLNQLMGPVRGVVIVIAVVLIVVHVPQVVTLSKRALLRVRALVPSVTPGIAYPLEKRTRTGLTIAMFSLVIVVVVAFSTFAATFQVDLKSQSGGYDVEAESTIPVADLEAHWRASEAASRGEKDPLAVVKQHDDLRYAQAFGGELVRIEGERVNYQGPPVDWVYSYTSSFAANNQYSLTERSPKYATDRAAYDAVLADPTLVIVSTLYTLDESGQPGHHHAGDKLTFETAGGTVAFTIVGVQKQFYLGGVWVNEQVLRTNFQKVKGEYLMHLAPGVDAKQAAKDLEAGFEDVGMNAVSISEEAAKRLEQNRQFFTLFQLFLTFGLVVGIASLGIVTARSVIERRQEVGMLRAIGYSKRDVLRIFLIEILFTTTLGVVIGTVIGIVISYGVVASSDAVANLGIAFHVPVRDIALILGLTYVAVLLATLVPARAASRIPPAEAIRYIE